MTQLFQHFEANMAGRDFVVGDIHGCFYLLESLLAHVGFDKQRDRVFSLGDLIDRGAESHRCTEFLAKPWFHVIRGNHEHMLLAGAQTGTAPSNNIEAGRLWLLNGGAWFFRLSPGEQEAAYDAVAELPVAFEVDLPGGRSAGLVHADVLDDSWALTRAYLESRHARRNPGAAIETLVWSRERAEAVFSGLAAGRFSRTGVRVPDIELIWFGHTPSRWPLRAANTRWLDTGAGKGGALSIAEVGVDGSVWTIAESSTDVAHGWYELAG